MDIKFKFKGEGVAHDVDYVPCPEEIEEVIHRMFISEMGVHATVAVPEVKVIEK